MVTGIVSLRPCPSGESMPASFFSVFPVSFGSFTVIWGGGQLVNEYKKVIEKFRDLEYYSRDLPVSACELIAEGSPFTYRTFTILKIRAFPNQFTDKQCLDRAVQLPQR